MGVLRPWHVVLLLLLFVAVAGAGYLYKLARDEYRK
jgi:hypothetical protein